MAKIGSAPMDPSYIEFTERVKWNKNEKWQRIYVSFLSTPPAENHVRENLTSITDQQVKATGGAIREVAEMGGGGGSASSKLKKTARKIFVQTCGFFCQTQQQAHVLDTVSCDSPNYSSPPENQKRIFSGNKISSEIGKSITSPSTNKNLCAICLDPLNYISGNNNPSRSIFTAQCSHAFHFACISSNVRHGSVTCPICRAHWTQLPRNLNSHCSLHHNKTDPILQILDDSIANSRVHRRSFLQSARYDDDDPVDPGHTIDQPRLHISLSSVPNTHPRTYIRLALAHHPATDLVLVASPNGPHLRLMKQAMAVVVFSLRPTDRLAIVTYSSSAARVFPLRRMTSYGKRNALQVIDRLFYMGQADPMEGLKKGVKILSDRVHKNLQSSILHLTDCPSRSYRRFDMEVPVRIQRFIVAYGVGASNGLIMHEFEELLARSLGGEIRDIELRIGEGTRVVTIGELRVGEERNIPLCVGECGPVFVEYSYVECGDDECIRRGKVVVGMGDKIDGSESVGGRVSSGEGWDYHDPFMARRWAKHLHGYRM